MPEAQKAGEYEIILEGNEEVLRIDATAWPYSPSVEDHPLVMANTIDKLVESPTVSRLLFHQRRYYHYSYEQTQYLVEIARVYDHLVRGKKLFTLGALGFDEAYLGFIQEKTALFEYLIFNLLRHDPLGCYVEVQRLLREEQIAIERETTPPLLHLRKRYSGLLQYFFTLLDSAQLITAAKNQLAGYKLGDRTLYRQLFRPVMTPDFMYAQLMAQPPLNGEQIDLYTTSKCEVTLYRRPGDIKLLYHLYPPEFKLQEDEYTLLELARTVLADHKPRQEEFLDPQRMRKTFFNIGKDLLQELADHKQISLDYKRIEQLADVLVRYTVGFGLLELLLQDDKVQDIMINGPIGQTPIFLVHQDYGECVTNIIPSREDSDGWATKLRLLSGRPLDEANPILDTDLAVPHARSRVSVITSPLSPVGLSFSLRRHRDNPWTLPLFIEKKMLTPLAAAVLSFLIDGGRTLLFAGTRGSGKTSLLGASLIEIMRNHRILTVEDTLEIPVDALRQLGYNIQPMKVRAALMSGGNEVTADEGIRTSLRMGDSSLIVGEIRSIEAKALFEAMRIGALANVVAGTIHGASPYAVFDRIVNDLGVPKTSFKAVDIIVVSNPVRSADGLHSWRRILQITEVRKHWEEDPQKEAGFVDLFRYDSKQDALLPTDDLLQGNSEVLKSIASTIREWAGNWDAVWENILLRAKIKETLVKAAHAYALPELLEASFVVQSNDLFHQSADKALEQHGKYDNQRIFIDWEAWLRKEVKRRKFSTA